MQHAFVGFIGTCACYFLGKVWLKRVPEALRRSTFLNEMSVILHTDVPTDFWRQKEQISPLLWVECWT